MPSNGIGEMMSARLKSVQKLIHEQQTGDLSLAVEAGGRVYIHQGKHIKSYSLSQALLRPRQFKADP